jgi:hypothetical protein
VDEGNEEEEAKQAAINRWNMLKIQVVSNNLFHLQNHGYFKVQQKEAVDLSDFATAVDNLWRDSHQYSHVQLTQDQDSTLDFLSGKHHFEKGFFYGWI